MAKKSDRVIRREQKKANKQIKNQSRRKPKSVIEEPENGTRTFPKSHIITLDDLTNPDLDK
jgi:hypothetical protein|tara:strand:- start:1154 stop:1336 length:183 start_codon:yes stop_codon:yes gene_type:complete